MAVGFVLDSAGLKEISGSLETLLLYFYFFSAGILIILIHLSDARWAGKRIVQIVRPWLPITFQFIIGSWYSAFLVFYSHSASLSASWPFLIILFILFAGTEIFHRYQDRLVFQNALYFFAIFSFATSQLPLFLGTIGTVPFLLSGLASVLIFAFFLWLLYVAGPARLKLAKNRIIVAVSSIFIVINVFYFAHLLPPLPLILRDIGVYHSVSPHGGAYAVAGEGSSFLSHFLGGETVHIQKGGTAFVFSSVFTPIAIKTNLIHRWQQWDTHARAWETRSVITFPVSGGRDEGYRGFSEIPGIPEGEWRVSVETPDGALIGQISFTVIYTSEEPELVHNSL